MAAVELHNVDDAITEIARDLEGVTNGHRTWSVLGEPTAGKSAVLEGLRDYFTNAGSIRPVLVAPPTRAEDAAHAALIDLAEGLDLNQVARENMQDPHRSWESKVKTIRRALGHEGRIVLLLDEPDVWSPSDTHFSSLVRDVFDLVFDSSDFMTVAAGRLPVRVRHSELHLDPASDPDGVLAAITDPALQWARETVAEFFAADLHAISPLQIRLLVAIAALKQDAVHQIDPSAVDHRSALVEQLADIADVQAPGLRDVWLRLAAVREPFDQELLGLVGRGNLVPRDTAIIDQCLLFPRRHGLILHESLRTIDRRIEHDRGEVHRLLAGYYRHRFTDPEQSTDGRLRDSIEAFHHASNAGIFDLEAYKPFFVDQLNILGHRLSYEEQDRARAAEVFGVALSWDPKNPYAAHYRAYNLDAQAGEPGVRIDPAEVEGLYTLAVEQRPHHPWYWARWINFLIAQSRMDDARTAWLAANETFGADAADYIYLGLHLHVARNLLYRGEVNLTQAILRTLPSDVRRDPRFREIEARLWALREAEQRGSYLPAMYLEPDWWSHPKILSNTGLTRWIAARVIDVADDAVELDVADITPDGGPEYGFLELPLERLREWWKDRADFRLLEPGQFLEIGFYGPEGEDVEVRVHPRTRWEDRTRPFEDPDRYLRAFS